MFPLIKKPAFSIVSEICVTENEIDFISTYMLRALNDLEKAESVGKYRVK